MKTSAITVRKQARRVAFVSLAFFIVALPFAGDAYGQEAKLRIGHLEKLAAKAEEMVDVTLDQPMLQLASKFMSDRRSPDEVAARELIKQLKGIYVKSFEFDKEGEYSQAEIELVRAQLHAPDWSRVVDVHSKREGENAEVYIMGGADNITGLAIISAEPKELTVVPIDVDRLSDLEGHLGIPHLGLERTGRSKKEAGKEAANHEHTK